MENLSFGLDIATALSVIAAAAAFIWNSILSKRNERKERHKEIMESQVFKVAEKLGDEAIILFKEIKTIENLVLGGEMTQNLNPYRDAVQLMSYIFKSRIEPLSTTYGDGRLKDLAKEYDEKMNDAIENLIRLTGPETNEEWDFHAVMYKPIELTDSYIISLFSESEKYIEGL